MMYFIRKNTFNFTFFLKDLTWSLASRGQNLLLKLNIGLRNTIIIGSNTNGYQFLESIQICVKDSTGTFYEGDIIKGSS